MNEDIRLRYIEVNDGKDEVDNVPPKPEDYNMSVDIQVVCPRRHDCSGSVGGINVSNLTTKMENCGDNRYVSFMRGSGCIKEDSDGGNVDLTTSFLDISFTDNKTYHENIGIQSIDINFNTSFTPLVNISFIDIRGNALMNPAENDYMSDGSSEYSNFFQALFHFPYPQFFLTVKGYYGTPVTFMLAVEKFTSSFDSTTGNFLVNVSFVGYKYGLYTDIPFNVLLSAPFYDWDLWNSIKTECPFGGQNGNAGPMINFQEFIERANNLERSINENKLDGTTDTNKKERLENEKNVLSDIKARWGNFVDSIEYTKEGDAKVDNKPYRYTTSVFSNGYSYNVYYEDAVKENDNVVNKFTYNKETYKAFISSINSYIEEFGDNRHYKGFNGYYSPFFVNRQGKLIEQHNENYIRDSLCVYTFDKSFKTAHFVERGFKTGYTKTYDHWTSGKKVNGKYLNDIIGGGIKGDKVVFITLSIENEIDRAIAKIDKEIQNAIDGTRRELVANFNTNLGFTPHIGNMFYMFFAHLKCFMRIFYDQVLTVIQGEINRGERTCNKLGIELDNTDLTSDTVSLPPFPAFYKKDEDGRKVDVFPDGDFFDDGKQITEVTFIKQFYKAIVEAKINVNDSIIRESQAQEQFETANNNTSFIPTNFYDKGKETNPYSRIGGYDENMLGEALAVLVERLGLTDLIFKPEYTTRYFMVADEAKNFINQYPNVVTEQFRSIVKDSKGHADDILSKYIVKNKNIIKNKSSEILKSSSNNGFVVRIADLNTKFVNFKSGNSKKTFEEGVFFHNTDDFGFEEFISRVKNSDAIDETKAYFDEIVTIECEGIKKIGYKDIVVNTRDRTNKKIDFNVIEFLRAVDKQSNNYAIDRVYFTEEYKHSCVIKVPRYVVLYEGSKLNKSKEYPKNDILKKCLDFYNKWSKSDNYKKVEKFWEGIHYNKYNGNEDFSDLFEHLYENVYFEVYKKWWSDSKTNFIVENQYLNLFLDILIKHYGDENHQSTEQKYTNTAEELKDKDASEEVYLALYLTFKDLYNKWLCSYTLDNFELRSYEDEKSKRNDRYGYNHGITSAQHINEFNNFVFVDSSYRDISDKFYIDPKTVSQVLLNHYNGVTNWSFYQFFSELCAKNNILLNCLPMYTNITDNDGIRNMFKPHPLRIMEQTLGNTYVLMYTYRPSYGGGNNDYSSDSINLHSFDANPEELHAMYGKENDGDMIVPAFGVTYGRQNQNIFKSINVNMDNPITTDISIMNTFLLAGVTENGATNKTNTIANNLYNVYSNRAYTASVTMMGCANIMPMMMFQLNNIPLFRGAYMITKVTHSIKAGEFNTTFTGVRISPRHLPLNMNTYPILDSPFNGSSGDSGAGGTYPGCYDDLTPEENLNDNTQSTYIDMNVLLSEDTVKTYRPDCGNKNKQQKTITTTSHGQCTSGPSTWYIDAVNAKGYDIHFSGHWWNPRNTTDATTAHIDKIGFVVVDSTNAVLSCADANKWINDHLNRSDERKLKPGDIVTMHGTYKGGHVNKSTGSSQSSHAVMYYGKNGKKWISDYIQKEAFPYGATRGNLTIWRFSDEKYGQKAKRLNS